MFVFGEMGKREVKKREETYPVWFWGEERTKMCEIHSLFLSSQTNEEMEERLFLILAFHFYPFSIFYFPLSSATVSSIVCHHLKHRHKLSQDTTFLFYTFLSFPLLIFKNDKCIF